MSENNPEVEVVPDPHATPPLPEPDVAPDIEPDTEGDVEDDGDGFE